MAVATSQVISRYFDFYRDKEIILTKANLVALKMNPREIYIKCNGGQWPCIINSSSLQMAKIILGSGSGAFTEMKKNPGAAISIRYCFVDTNGEPIHFFVNCALGNISKYQNSEELAIVTLNFTQRPPDELITRLGEFVETNENFSAKKLVRIELNQDSIRKLGMDKEETMISVENIPRRCIIRYLAFGGAGVMFVGLPKFLRDKPIALKVDFPETDESVVLKGKIVNAAVMEGRQDIAVCDLEFEEASVPISYKFKINTFLTTYQKTVNRGANANNGFQVPVNQAGEPAQGKTAENGGAVIHTADETVNQAPAAEAPANPGAPAGPAPSANGTPAGGNS